MLWRVLLVGALLLASAAAMTLVVRALDQRHTDTVVIEAVGRQRMLSERLAMQALLGAIQDEADLVETRRQLVLTADRLANGGEIEIDGLMLRLPAPEPGVIRELWEGHELSIESLVDVAERLVQLEPSEPGYADAVRALNVTTAGLQAELDETVRLLVEHDAREVASARRWAIASAGLAIALCLFLLVQVFRSAALDRRLRTSEERLQLAVLGTNDGLWDWSMVTDEVHYSRRFEELLGFAENELRAVADSIRSRVHPEDRNRVFAAFDRHVKSQEPFDEECRLRHKNGSYGFFRVRGRAVWNESGWAIRMAGAITDIGDRKAAEERLEKRAQEAQLVHLATSMAAETDSLEDALQTCVDSVCRTTGWPIGHAYVPEDGGSRFLVPTNIWHLPAGGHRALRAATRSTRFERGVGLSGRIWETGAPVWIEDVQAEKECVSARPFQALGVRAAFGFPIKVRGEVVAVLEFFAGEMMRHDPDLVLAVGSVGEQVGRVIERKRGQDELLNARDAAQHANRAKSQFLANMSHELRTPLNSVIGFSNVLLRGIGSGLPDKERTFLERIRDNGVHLLSLINEVLDISKIEAGKMDLRIESVELDAIVSEVCADLEVAASDAGLLLHQEVPGGLQPVLADAARLKQVLINLVANALKFTQNGSVTVRVRAAGTSRAPTRVEVVDTGIGISKEQLPTIFDSFQQADGSTTRRFSGSGLGLTISRSLCRLMGFDLVVESEFGRGSTFAVEFRRVSDTRGAFPARKVVPADSVSQRVLVIDDDPDTCVLLGEYLGDLGCEVVAAASGEEGVTVASEWSPDLITLDLMMPGMNGWEVLRRLKSDAKLRDIPVVVVSIVAAENRGTLLGAVDALSKPIRREDLLRVLNRLPDGGIRRALVVEDDASSRSLLVELLSEQGLQVVAAETGLEGLRVLEAAAPDVIILDLLMPVMGGTEFLARLRERPGYVDLPVVVVTAKELSRAEMEELEERGAAVLLKGGALESRLKKVVFSRLQRRVPVASRA